MSSYTIHFDICACIVSFVTISIFLSKRNWHRAQGKLLLFLVLVEFATEICDIASSLLLSSGRGQGVPFAVCTMLYYVCHIASSATIAAYVVRLAGRHRRYEPGFWFLFFLPFLLCTSGILVNPLSGWLFTVPADGRYLRHWFVAVLYATAAFYFLCAACTIARHGESIILSQGVGVLALLFTAAASVLQLAFPLLLMELFVQSLMTLCLLTASSSFSDSLNSNTGVSNRRSFMLENLNLLKGGIPYTVIIIKLLNHQYYLSSFGYLFMRDVLYQVAQWLVSITDDDAVFDCENSTFALILYDKDRRRQDVITKQLELKFQQEWFCRNVHVSFHAQIFALEVPQDVDKLENLIALVDTTDAKSDTQVSVIHRDQLMYLKRRGMVENAIEKALQQNTFKVYYQPIWDCKANRIHSAEALVRLFDDEMGSISPEEFIPYAEKNGSVTAIGQFVLEDVCHLFIHGELERLGLSFIEVNLSTVQCMHKSLPDIFKSTLEHYGLPSSRVNLEITESAAINSQETFLSTIDSLRKLGFSFSLDDYGTGYSNASYIFNMDFNIIKIDKSILWEAEKKDSGRIILRNTVRMIKEMNMKILVEGVETEAQKDLVVDLGCDYCQGYYFSRPVPKDEFIAYCREFNGIQG